jgi:acyl transferase domain-containing protein/NAD(P)-dependent dehydrogenase (short-subunit alcohol dehydrogenase family)/SAM-dependent methyltransferase
MSDFLDRIGKLSPKRLALLALEQHEKIEAAARRASEPIAVVGLGCRLPGGVTDPESYWQLLHGGRDAICDVPRDRWDADVFFDPDPDAPGKMSVRNGGFLADAASFDPAFFGIAPREALTMDPQQRLLLEVTWQALEHAGIAPEGLAGSATGVFVGICNSDYYKRLLNRSADSIDAYFASGNAASVAAGRISYCLGLQGPAMSIDTACSSSLVSLHVACRSLRSGESRLAIAAGVNLMCSPETTIALSKSHMLAPDGRCKTFDARADGFARGEGCGVVILKRLADALADGDRVLALIRGTAVNQDGRSGGLTVPNGPAQEAVIRAALADAGVQPEDIHYVEAHGTGTSLGDPIEVHALGGALCADRGTDNPLLIGSVKTNLGHLESAAGIAGVIKVVLALQNERIPAHLHFTDPSPHIAWDRFAISVTAAAAPWPRGERRRLAGVSSFGFSGTNAHCVIEEAPIAQTAGAAAEHRPLHCLPLSARSDGALRALAQLYAATFVEAGEDSFPDLINTAGVGRSHFGERAAIVAATPRDTAAALDSLRLGKPHPALHRGTALAGQPPEVVFLFTGQGSQYSGMSEQLYAGSPVFREIIDRCDGLLGADAKGRTLKSVLWERGAGAAVDETSWTQPALFAVEYAVAQVWRSWGVEPAAVLGHSVGEYAAACVAGVFTLEEGLRLIAERGRLMQTCGAGRMAAVFTSATDAAAAVAPFANRVSIAAINAPDSIVISGEGAAVDAILQQFAEREIRGQPLAVSVAAHSPLVDPILDAMQTLAAGVVMRAPRIPVAWNLTGGRPLAGGAAPDAGYWRRHMREPVRFADGVTHLYEQGLRTFLEVGPHPTLIALAQRSLPEDPQVALLSSLGRGRSDWAGMLGSLARLYVGGARIDWARVTGPAKRGTLPGYPFERSRYWVQASQGAATPASPLSHGRRDALRASRMPTAAPLFQTTLTSQAPDYMAGHRVHGAVLTAAGVFLELAQGCAQEARGNTPWAIEELVIAEPMVLTDSGRVVEVNLSAAEAGRFEISSRAAQEESPWTLHVSGRFVDALRAPTSAVPTAALRAKLAQVVDCDLHYQHLAELGIELSGAFRCLREAHCGDGEALARIALDPGEQTDSCRWAHPGLIDGALQTVGLAVADAAGPDELALVVGMQRAELYVRLPATLWCHAKVRDPAKGAASWLADVTLRDAEGSVIGVLQGVRLQRASRAALERLGGKSASRLFYELTWEESAVVTPGAASLRGPNSFDASLRREFERLAVLHGMSVYRELLPELDRLCVAHIVGAFLQLGFDLSPGRGFTVASEATRLGVIARHGKLFERLLDMLVEEGLLRRQGAGRLETTDTFEYIDPTSRYDELLRRFAAVDGELRMLCRCANRLAAVLTGAQDPLQLLFPGGSLQEARQIYIESPYARTYNSAVAFALESAIAELAPTARLRILEIGAGTGGTTSYLMTRLRDRADYTFTDVSALFVEQAQQKFAEHPCMRFSLLDVERDPVSQGFQSGEYDVVIAANVLHATADLRRTVEHARNLLAPGGLLLLLEGVRPERWVDLTFGMTEGWWRFADTLRTDYPLISRDAWRQTLREVGFDDVSVLPDGAHLTRDLAQQALIVARLPARRREWVIIGNADGCGAALEEELRTRGDTVTLVDPDALDTTLPQGGELIYLGAVGAAGREALELSCELPLRWLARAARPDSNLRIWLVTQGCQSVAGEISPAARWQSPLWGVGRVFALEHPRNWGGVMDLPPQATPDTCARMVLDSVDAYGSEDQFAWRRDKRFVSRLQAVAAPAARTARLRGDATYLITGGYGGLGLLVALWMAQNGARHIALLGRRPQIHSQAIKDIEAAGARVIALAGDVADEAAMQAHLQQLAREAPQVRGIVHAAADLSVAPIADINGEQVRAMLRPKVDGLLVLERLTRSQQLDFMVLFSSSTALLGAAGYAHYAAANAFLDATAVTLDRPGRRVVSINWGTWQAMRLASAESQRSFREAGLQPIAAEEALQALGALLSGERAQMMVAQIDWKVLKPLHEARRVRPLLARFGEDTAQAEDEPVQATLVSRLAAAEASERAEIIVEWLQDEVSAVLGLADARSAPLEQGLFEMGMDSLMSVELRKRLERGVGRSLPATLTFNYPNIAALANYLQRTDTVAAAPAVPPNPSIQTGDLDSLDDEELESRLRARLEAVR